MVSNRSHQVLIVMLNIHIFVYDVCKCTPALRIPCNNRLSAVIRYMSMFNIRDTAVVYQLPGNFSDVYMI